MGEEVQLVTLAALTHDVAGERSLATLVSATDPDKRITLAVPYGCALESAVIEADKAPRAFAIALGGVTVGPSRRR